MAIEAVPQVSVIVCAYRSGPRILPTLRSILDQSFADFELIVIDDASGDDTVEIIDSLTDDRIRLVRNATNLGVAGSRNRGIDEARATLIAHCDHDDVWEPGKLDAQVRYLQQHPACGLLGTGLRKLINGRPLTEVTLMPEDPAKHELHWSLLFAPPFAHSSVVYRKDLFANGAIRYRSDLDFADDWDVFLRIARSTEVAMLPQPFVSYHLHGENWSSRGREQMSTAGVSIQMQELMHWLGKPLPDSVAEDFFYAMSVGRGCRSAEALRATGRLTVDLFEGFMRGSEAPQDQRTRAAAEAGRRWWRAVCGSSHMIGAGALRIFDEAGMPAWWRPPLSERLRVRASLALRTLKLHTLKREGANS